jgi:predicted HTH domain antitoxin
VTPIEAGVTGCLSPEKRYGESMVIEIQDEALRGLNLTQPQALLDLAVGLFTERRITLGRGAEIACLSQPEFQQELGRRGNSLHYDVEDLQADLHTLASMREK